jgi:peroxiredoxin
MPHTVIPRQPAPSLTVETLKHGKFDLGRDAPQLMTLVVFYRGLHCPFCATQLQEMENVVDDFASRGVKMIALSTDSAPRAQAMAEKCGIEKLRLGYGLSLADAKRWDLYLSTGGGKNTQGVEINPIYSEPGLFLIKADGTVHYVAIQSAPQGRPAMKDILGAVDFNIKNNAPSRGDYTGTV